MKKNISLSILNVDKDKIPDFLAKYKKCIDRLEELKIDVDKFSYMLHFDIMDGKFVKNIGVDIEYIKTAKNLGFYVDTHLMVENPIGDKYVEKAIKYGTDDITIHCEIDNFESILKYLNDKKKSLKKECGKDLTIGVAVKPDTDLSGLVKYKDKFSKLLVMSVNPGFGGQKYIESTNKRLKEAKKLFENHILQVDGGVKFNTLNELLNLKMESIVMGSYLTQNYTFKLYSKLLKLNILKSIEELTKDRNVDFDKKTLQIVKGRLWRGRYTYWHTSSTNKKT